MLINFCVLSVAPTVSFGELTYSVDEHNGSALLTVVLSKQSSMDITIKVLTVDGSAIGESILEYFNKDNIWMHVHYYAIHYKKYNYTHSSLGDSTMSTCMLSWTSHSPQYSIAV